MPGLATSVRASQDDDDDEEEDDDDDDDADVFDFETLLKTQNDCMINCSTGPGHLIFS